MSRKEPAAKPEEDFSAQRNAAYDYVDRVFKIEEIYGERGSQIVQRLAARASTPAMPLGLSLQIALCSCANGAVAEVFPGSSSPLSLIALNCNVTQTRKSQLTQVLDDISAVIDEACQRRAAQHGPEEPGKLTSVMLAMFTEQAFLQRCSPQWPQAVV